MFECVFFIVLVSIVLFVLRCFEFVPHSPTTCVVHSVSNVCCSQSAFVFYLISMVFFMIMCCVQVCVPNIFMRLICWCWFSVIFQFCFFLKFNVVNVVFYLLNCVFHVFFYVLNVSQMHVFSVCFHFFSIFHLFKCGVRVCLDVFPCSFCLNMCFFIYCFMRSIVPLLGFLLFSLFVFSVDFQFGHPMFMFFFIFFSNVHSFLLVPVCSVYFVCVS